MKNFGLLATWEDRYRYVIELGRKLPAFPEESRTEDNLVRGCSSRVWMVRTGAMQPGVVSFAADSDSHLVKGLIGILISLFDRRGAEEIIKTDIRGHFERLGLEKHLSANRTNGFYSMVEKIRRFAVEEAVQTS